MTMSGSVQQRVDTNDFKAIHEAAQQIRVDAIRCSTKAGSGHPTSSMSAADLMAVLATRHLRYDWEHPELVTNDHLIFSKGHASPLLYGLYRVCGAISDSELLTYRTLGSRLQGHPTPEIPWVDVATGSLGQGLPIAVGVAYCGKHIEKLDFQVYTLCGDSELAEGSIWEALDKAAHYSLDNLTVIFDVNRLGQRGATELGWDTDAYRRRVEAFGCHAIVVDGHDVQAIDAAFVEARGQAGMPSVIIARTIKGKGFSEIENKDGWHGKALPEDMAQRAIVELGGEHPDLRIEVAVPQSRGPLARTHHRILVQPPTYKKGDKVAPRKAFGDALAAMVNQPMVAAVDAEVGNSTHLDLFAEHGGPRYIEAYIAEQQMIGFAVGLSVRGYVAFASTFAAFMSRAFDFIRMASISQANLRLVGTHAGVEIGADGPSQMALEDLAMMRAVRGSTVLYPSDAVSCAKLTLAMAHIEGISYLRATRGAYPVLYDNDEEFPVGGSKLLVDHGDQDQVALIAAGVTLHNCLAAELELSQRGIKARVIDLYSVKPVDTAQLRAASAATGGRLVVVEDHYPEGGLGSAVMEAMTLEATPPRVTQLAVRGLPGSGPTDELLAAAGLDAASIVKAAMSLVTER